MLLHDSIFAGCIQVFTIEFKSYISGHGLHGTISFVYSDTKKSIKIITNLNTTLQYPEQVWSWFVTEYPVDYTEMENRCNEDYLGKIVLNLANKSAINIYICVFICKYYLKLFK